MVAGGSIGSGCRSRSHRDRVFPGRGSGRRRSRAASCRKHLDEHPADCLSFVLRLDLSGELSQKELPRVDHVQIRLEMTAELVPDRVRFPFPQQPVVHEDAGERSGQLPGTTERRRRRNRRLRRVRKSRVFLADAAVRGAATISRSMNELICHSPRQPQMFRTKFPSSFPPNSVWVTSG